MDAITDVVPRPGLAPFSLKDAPALIERVFPAQKIGIEAQKERKAGAGQTLTALGSYWKGRKPLVLVRACVLASLLPATENPDEDLEVFEMLMRMDEDGMWKRGPKISAQHVRDCLKISPTEKLAHLASPVKLLNEGESDDARTGRGAARWLRPMASESSGKEERAELCQRAFRSMPFSEQVAICERVERVEQASDGSGDLYEGVWERVNSRLGTNSSSLPDLVRELGVARFGHKPVVGDPFCGGGSIPFEAARLGADVVASDLNPVAAMLTWGALNILGNHGNVRDPEGTTSHDNSAKRLEAEISALCREKNASGDHAKSYLYCLEVRDPQTGWLVPMAPSWIISRNHGVAARLVPDYAKKRFDIVVESGLSASQMQNAEAGTIIDGALTYRLALVAGEAETLWRIPVARLREDGERASRGRKGTANGLRPWVKHDFMPRPYSWQEGEWRGGDI